MNRPIGLATVAASAAFAYGVLLGGTAIGEVDPFARALNLVVGGIVVGVYVLRAPVIGDKTDGLVAVGLAAFTLACLFSLLPRQSFDAAVGALTLAATFFVARGVLNDGRRRRFLAHTAMALSGVIVAIFIIQWSAVVVEWMARTGWNTVPPLNLNFSTSPWGHRHDAALLVVALYPAWWVGRQSALRRFVAVIVGGLTAVIVALDGSRNLWLAIVIATLLVFAAPTLKLVRRAATRTRALIVAAPLTVLMVVMLSPLVERLLTAKSLETRAGMWEASMTLWLDHPLTGIGPGTFPWALQQTGWFDANSWAPRHPDGSLIQLLAESGALGVLAVTCVAVAVAPAVIGRRWRAASWGITVLVAAGLAASPTDFAFLNLIGIFWAAYALPRHHSVQATRQSGPRVAVRTASVVLVSLAGAATALSVVGAVAFSVAINAIRAGDAQDALRPLSWAVELDPHMALYHRQRGAALLLVGDSESAADELRVATTLNPSDDTAWRVLALSQRLRGDSQAAEGAYDQAVTLQRSDATNLLLLLQNVASQGDTHRARRIAAEVVETWPQVISAPGWLELTAPLGTGADLVEAALTRWEGGESPAAEISRQPLVLAGMARDRDLLAQAWAQSGLSRALATAMWSTYACRPEAESALAHTTASDRRITDFWLLHGQLAATRGDSATLQNSLRVAELMGGASIGDTFGAANPLNENVAPGFSLDVWGYRRPAVDWPSTPWDVPSWRVGRARWALDPLSAAATAGLSSCGLIEASGEPTDTVP